MGWAAAAIEQSKARFPGGNVRRVGLSAVLRIGRKPSAGAVRLLAEAVVVFWNVKPPDDGRCVNDLERAEQRERYSGRRWIVVVLLYRTSSLLSISARDAGIWINS